VSYKLTKKAQVDLSALVDFSLGRFGVDTAVRDIDTLERALESLARGDFEGPELLIASRARPVRRWPVPPLRSSRREPAGPSHLSRRSRTPVIRI